MDKRAFLRIIPGLAAMPLPAAPIPVAHPVAERIALAELIAREQAYRRTKTTRIDVHVQSAEDFRALVAEDFRK